MSAIPARRSRLDRAASAPALASPGAALTGAREPVQPGALPATGVVIIGSSSAVRMIAAQLAAQPQPCIPVGCVLTTRLSDHGGIGFVGSAGVLPPPLGFVDELIDLHARYRFRLALVSLPRAQEAEQRRLAHLLRTLEVPARWIPALDDLVTGRVSVAGPSVRVGAGDIDPADLIGRTHSGLDRRAVGAVITGQRVLITGAGGSIGSELCRVVAGFAPGELLLVERAENALFQIDHAMARRFPGVARRALLHDVVDEAATARLLARLKPHVVFHAAAHKHVPLMEDHPSHAVSNNLFGTKSIADASLGSGDWPGVERFVMISSDKAVNPTSVMGATKRMAEMYIQALAGRARSTRFSMVRFGNVLASACSVIPIWSQQMAEGHPITVTDARMTRYFMTIPEAATLVVQAAALEQPAGSAPVYLLDMGEPIRILDLAVRFVRAQGFEPRFSTGGAGGAAKHGAPTLPPEAQAIIDDMDLDASADAAHVDITFTGARPGEKLYEELAYDAERLASTAHPAINQWSADGVRVDPAAVDAMVREMTTLREPHADKAAVIDAIRRRVPEMKAAGQ